MWSGPSSDRFALRTTGRTAQNNIMKSMNFPDARRAEQRKLRTCAVHILNATSEQIRPRSNITHSPMDDTRPPVFSTNQTNVYVIAAICSPAARHATQPWSEADRIDGMRLKADARIFRVTRSRNAPRYARTGQRNETQIPGPCHRGND